MLKIDKTHILEAKSMADAIYKERPEYHTAMLKTIKDRLIELHEQETSKLEMV